MLSWSADIPPHLGRYPKSCRLPRRHAPGRRKKKTQLSEEPVIIFVILPATGCAHTNVSTVPATHLSEQAKRNWNILRGSEISVVCQPSKFIQRDTDVRWRVRGLPLPLKYYKAHCTSHATRFVQSNSLPVEWIADLALPSRVQCFWNFFFSMARQIIGFVGCILLFGCQLHWELGTRIQRSREGRWRCNSEGRATPAAE